MSSFNEQAKAEIESLFARVKQGRFVTTQQAVTPYEDPIGPGQINPVGFIAQGALSQIDLFADDIRPPVVVSSLPALPDDLYPQGSFAFLTTDGKLYRTTDGTTWTAAVASSDITGHVGIPISASAPVLPDTTYPAGSYYWNSVSLALFKTTNGTTWIKAIEAVDIVANTITAGQIAAGTITATEIAALTITGAKIVAGTITADKILANSITAGQIAAGTITATEIAANTITAAKIAAGTITATELAALSVTASKLNILDAAGQTVLTGAGFGGSWLDFLASGFYNGNFASGTTTNITAATIVGTASSDADYLASASADIPPWIVNSESGAGTLKRVADSAAVGGFALQWDGNETAEVFQDIPVIPGQDYLPYVTLRYTNSASDFTIELETQFRKSDHSAIGSKTASGGANYTLSQATYIVDLLSDPTGLVPANARFLRVFIKVTRGSGSPTIWLNTVSVSPQNHYGGIGIVSPTDAALAIRYANTDTQPTFQISDSGNMEWGVGITTAPDVSLGRNGVGILSADASVYFKLTSGILLLNTDAYIRRSATKTITFDTDGAGTALTAVVLAGATPLRFSTDAYIYRSATKTLTFDTDGAGAALTLIKIMGAALKFGLASELAAVITEGYATWNDTNHYLTIGDSVKAKPVTPVGWAPRAYAIGFEDSTFAGTVEALSVVAGGNGGALLIPFHLTAPMLLNGYGFWNTNTASARSAEARLYRQVTSADGSLTFITGSDATWSFTPGAAATRNSGAVSGAPVMLAPGVYWLAVRNTSAAQTFGVGTGTNVLVSNRFLGGAASAGLSIAALGTTMDSTVWTKKNTIPSFAMLGYMPDGTTVW